ncbi:1-acyl-sn-glycerol-3-phosphate acyltransferase [Parapedobacter sp. DT-150]|uniref:1-acyl-sn-glycerol-3-phosphate acyltransferase n=1 Tax=Parapedobacter sp. DT-150 TaxID=3396162 RepID=UPI003F1C0D78
MESKDKYIVVREIIRKKNPQLLRWMPRFILRYIERIVHEDDINRIMAEHGHLQGLDFVEALITDLGVIVELHGEENIPMEGGAIFASNHPLGGLDGIAFMHALGKYRKDIKFLVNDILLNIKNLEPLFVGVNKHGMQDRTGTRQIEEAYAQDQALLVFPAGLVSRKRNGKIEDLQWKKSFISKAKKYQRNVVPVYIDGKNSGFFYNFARFRERIGIKANIEMFYLADEMFAQKDKKVTICIGKPISYTYFDGSKSEREWAEYLKQVVYNLAPQN